jgi:hypothetical protein
MNERIAPSKAPSTLSRVAVETTERVGFWGTVVLPATYFPVLYGLSDETKLLTLTVLVALNIVCLLLGQRYRT